MNTWYRDWSVHGWPICRLPGAQRVMKGWSDEPLPLTVQDAKRLRCMSVWDLYEQEDRAVHYRRVEPQPQQFTPKGLLYQRVPVVKNDTMALALAAAGLRDVDD